MKKEYFAEEIKFINGRIKYAMDAIQVYTEELEAQEKAIEELKKELDNPVSDRGQWLIADEIERRENIARVCKSNIEIYTKKVKEAMKEFEEIEKVMKRMGLVG